MKCKNPNCETGHVRTGTCDWYGFPHMQKCPNCNGTGEQPEDPKHDSSEEIRKAFEEFNPNLNLTWCDRLNLYYDNNTRENHDNFKNGIETATAKSQAEIEFLENALDAEVINRDNANRRVSELEQSAITMAEVYQNTLDKLKKQYKTEEHKCCGHCKRESDHPKVTCAGVGRCDNDGIGCDENNNCGEYVRIHVTPDA